MDFKDKSVVLIGAAPTLINKNKGYEFDNNYDIVVRLNHGLPIKNERDYGKVCNVLFINRMFYKRILLKNFDYYNQLYHENDVKLIVTFWDDYSLLKKIRIDFELIDSDFITKIKTEMLACPYMGMHALKWLMNTQAKSITVTGMSFYMGDKIYYNDYKNHPEPQPLHDPCRNFNWFKKQCESDRVIPDEFLAKAIQQEDEIIYYCDNCAKAKGWRITAHKMPQVCPQCGTHNGLVNVNFRRYLTNGDFQ